MDTPYPTPTTGSTRKAAVERRLLAAAIDLWLEDNPKPTDTSTSENAWLAHVERIFWEVIGVEGLTQLGEPYPGPT